MARVSAETAPCVAVNAAFAAQRSGIGRYSAQLIRHLQAGELGDRLLPLSPAPGASRTLWLWGEVEPALRRAGAGLFHGVANFDLPLVKPRRTAYVLTVQDLIPLERPQATSPAYRLQFRAWLSRSLVLADRVICTTQAVAGALRDRFPAAPPVRVVPLAATVRPSAWRPPRPYLLCAGSIEERKNVETLLRGFAQFSAGRAANDAELWLVGSEGFGGSGALALAARTPGVRVLGPQSQRSLERLMAGALCLCAPSLAEGFGLPPLEALAAGTPVVASDIPAHREVLGDAAELVAASDVDAWAHALSRAVHDDTWRAGRTQAGPARAAAFSWERTAQETAAVYRELL